MVNTVWYVLDGYREISRALPTYEITQQDITHPVTNPTAVCQFNVGSNNWVGNIPMCFEHMKRVFYNNDIDICQLAAHCIS